MNIWRQGDVIVKRVPNGSLAGLELKPDGVLAVGQNGHKHEVRGGAGLFLTNGNSLLLKIKDSASVVHPEHIDCVLPAGEYEVIVQREFDWFSEEVRAVLD